MKGQKKILSDNATGHNALAELLIEKEVIFAEDLEKIFGKRPWTSRNDELMAQNNGNDDELDVPVAVETPKLSEENSDDKVEPNVD
jgi:cell division protease FtsH